MFNLHSPLYSRLLNVTLRAISMISKFLLIISLAKLLPSSELGIYGLLVAGVGLAVLFVGFDYYTYSNRELLSVKHDEWSTILVNQIYAYIPLYIIFIPISILLYSYEVLPNGYFIWFLLLMLIEHISTELNRLLNTMQKQLWASMVLFLKSGLWVLCMLPFLIYVDSFRSLDTVLYAWLAGGVSSILFGVYVIYSLVQNWSFNSPSYAWIKKGYKIGALFLIGTVALQTIATGDKFLLEQMSSVEMVGVYVFYGSLTIGASAFIHAGVIVFSAPKIVKSYQNGKKILFKKLMSKFFKELIISIFIMILALYIFMPFVIDWLDKPEYLEHYNIFYIILGTTAMSVLSSHPGTYLYASRRDRYVLFSNIFALIVFLLLSSFFYFSDIGFTALFKVSLSVLITFLWILLNKYGAYFYYTRRDG